jgi:membrane-bound ClpP family serine protease
LDWITVIGLIVFGILLLIAEIIFVPGTTLVGILGLLFTGYGIYLGYDYFGATTGTILLFTTVILNLIALVIAFKGKSWEKFSLKSSMTGKFNQDLELDLKVGDTGISISSLKPIGKALFKEMELEVRSNGGYVNENVEIEIIRIESKKIFVQPVNQ